MAEPSRVTRVRWMTAAVAASAVGCCAMFGEGPCRRSPPPPVADYYYRFVLAPSCPAETEVWFANTLDRAAPLAAERFDAAHHRRVPLGEWDDQADDVVAAWVHPPRAGSYVQRRATLKKGWSTTVTVDCAGEVALRAKARPVAF